MLRDAELKHANTDFILFVFLQGQGAISERLRSFSIPDLTQVPTGQSALGKPVKLTQGSGN